MAGRLLRFYREWVGFGLPLGSGLVLLVVSVGIAISPSLSGYSLQVLCLALALIIFGGILGLLESLSLIPDEPEILNEVSGERPNQDDGESQDDQC